MQLLPPNFQLSNMLNNFSIAETKRFFENTLFKTHSVEEPCKCEICPALFEKAYN